MNGANANSYISVADADTYFTGRLYVDDWTGATTDNKERALQMATRELDKMEWAGTVATTTQALRWGRSGVYDRDDTLLPSDEIPQDILNATCELAISLLESNRYADPEGAGIDRVRAGEVEVEFDSSTRATRNPVTVNQMINPYLQSPSSGNWTYLNRA